jgi:ASCH domain
MKALSIKQPWASLIANGIKNIENRTWKTNFRGRIYIHASSVGIKEKFSAINEIQRQMIANYPKFNPLYFNDLHRSAIIGEVDIIDCVINHPSIWAKKSEFQCCGCFPTNDCNPCSDFKRQKEKGIKPIYNWVLANPILYDKPILNVKGKLSFWDFEIKH